MEWFLDMSLVCTSSATSEARAEWFPPGSDILSRWTTPPMAKRASIQTKVGFVITKEPPRKQLVNLVLIDFDFEIRLGAPNHSGHTWSTLDEAATLLYSQPHL
jgi:hypothetical protein